MDNMPVSAVLFSTSTNCWSLMKWPKHVRASAVALILRLTATECAVNSTPSLPYATPGGYTLDRMAELISTPMPPYNKALQRESVEVSRANRVRKIKSKERRKKKKHNSLGIAGFEIRRRQQRHGHDDFVAGHVVRDFRIVGHQIVQPPAARQITITILYS